MFKSENIVVTNGITHCKMKRGSKKVFDSNTLFELITKISCIFMRNKEPNLLNSRK